MCPIGLGNEDARSMEEFLSGGYRFKRLKQGGIVEGTVVRASPTELLIDVGAKSEGLVSPRELERMGPEAIEQIKVGDRVPAYVITPEDKNGNILLSLHRARLERDWLAAERLFSEEEVFEGVVAGYNKAGLIVQVGKVRGFVPASQLASVRRGDDRQSSENPLAAMVGKSLRLKVIDLDRENNRLILSEKEAMRQWREEQKDGLLAELREGEVRRGRVSNLCDFGAFVDLGGADGLIHRSELSWGGVAHPSEVLKVGDEVDIYVLRVDRQKRRIALSLKRLQPEPWDSVGERYTVGQLVKGTITKLTEFGAFARLEDGIEGLIHISELSEKRIQHPKEVLREGDALTLRVIHIDGARRRLGLSLRQVKGEVEDDVQ